MNKLLLTTVLFLLIFINLFSQGNNQDSLLQSIIDHGQYESAFVSIGVVSTQYKRWDDFSKSLNNDDLLELIKHESPVIRVYAIEKLLSENKSSNHDLLIPFLTDFQNIETLIGCINSRYTVRDLILESMISEFGSLTPTIYKEHQFLTQFDSLLLFNYHLNDEYTMSWLSRVEIPNRYLAPLKRLYLFSGNSILLANPSFVNNKFLMKSIKKEFKKRDDENPYNIYKALKIHFNKKIGKLLIKHSEYIFNTDYKNYLEIRNYYNTLLFKKNEYADIVLNKVDNISDEGSRKAQINALLRAVTIKRENSYDFELMKKRFLNN